MKTRTNTNPSMATNRGPWTAPQNVAMVEFIFRMHAAKLPDGSLPRGLAASEGRALLAVVNQCGPDRTSVRPNGKARSDWYNLKVGNVNAILTAMGLAQYRFPGVPDYANTQKEKADPMADALLWRTIESAAAIAKARANIAK
jgi:hypothetical protein